jgi:hypothetical protein
LFIKYFFEEHPMTAKRWIFIVIIIVGLTACDGSPDVADLRNEGYSQAWIDAPLPNSTIPKLPYKLIFHGASASGIAEFEVWINGVLTHKVLPSSTDNNGTLFFGEFLWTPVAPGTFLIEVKAIGNGQDSSSDQVYVKVMGEEDERDTPVPSATATTRPTIAPTITAPTATTRPTTAPNTPIPEVGQIKIHLFADANSNGIQDGSEVDYRNVRVSLRPCSCSARCSESHHATTNDNGNALFSNLPYGPYCVSTDSGLTPTTTYPVNVNVNSPALVTINIGYTN